MRIKFTTICQVWSYRNSTTTKTDTLIW